MKFWKFMLISLTLFAVLAWFAALSSTSGNLELIACDVGQGDAILVIYKNIQILTDGGPNNDVLDCLAEYMPFYDRKIELVVLTHAQKDHFYGLIEVFKRYDVDYFLLSEARSNTQEFKVLENIVGGEDVKIIKPETGTTIRLGKIYLDILYPNSKVLGSFNLADDLNDYSVITQLHFGSFDALFTGDATPKVLDGLVLQGVIQDVEYLKVPHHGSKNGLTATFLKAAQPEVSVIPVGKNRWGHPHTEVLKMLEKEGAGILRTDEKGDVIIKSDGEKIIFP